MDVVHCPSCGSDEVEHSSYSAEYMRSSRWECEDCDWYYKKGSGMGTGSGNAGTHPRKAGPDEGQATLTQVGEWCRNCETCIKGDHGCRPEEHLSDENDYITVDEIVNELEEWHYDGMEVLAEAIAEGEVTLTPSFMGVIKPRELNEEVLRNELEDTIAVVIENDESEYFRQDAANWSKVADEVGAENKAERAFVKRELNQMWRDGRIKKSKFGYKSK